MTKHLVFAVLSCGLAVPATAGDMFPNYWDRYAVMMSNEPVPEDSDTSSFFRSQYGVMTLSQARVEAVARAARKAADDAHHDAAPGAKGAGGCNCACERTS
jgi:hypothetical protein